MNARSRAAAGDDLTAVLQRAISCVSDAVIIPGRYASDAPLKLVLPQRSAPLRGRHRLNLLFLHSYVLGQHGNDGGAWRASSTAYWYQPEERDSTEVIAFHWRPNGHGHVPFPHLHVDGGTGSVRIGRKGHVPTGRVSLEGVVRFAIEELGVRPLRSDWHKILDEGQRAFDTARTW